MKFSNWVKSNKNNESINLLEKILLDIKNSINILENFDSEDEDPVEDEGPVEIPDPFADGDENIEPTRVYDGENEEETEKRNKKNLIRNTRESMFNLRYKAMLSRRTLVNKLNRLNPSSPDFVSEATRIMNKLGYNTADVMEAYKIAKEEKGNDVPATRIQFLRSKKLKEFRKELLENIYKTFAFYAKSNPERYSFEDLSDSLEKIANSLTKRVVTKSNKVSDWSNPAPLVDSAGSAVIKFITASIVNAKTDNYRRKRKEISYGTRHNSSDEDSYKDTIKHAGTLSGEPSRELANQELVLRIRNSLEKLKTKDPKKVAAFCTSLGLDCYRNGAIEIPQNLEIGPMFKQLKSGELSDKIDLPELAYKLNKDHGIQATEANLRSWLHEIRNFMMIELGDLIKSESLSFSGWFAING